MLTFSIMMFNFFLKKALAQFIGFVQNHNGKYYVQPLLHWKPKVTIVSWPEKPATLYM